MTYQLGIDLCVKASVADKVDDPPLCIIRRHVQLLSQHSATPKEQDTGISQRQNVQTMTSLILNNCMTSQQLLTLRLCKGDNQLVKILTDCRPYKMQLVFSSINPCDKNLYTLEIEFTLLVQQTPTSPNS
jgi:hypothetical protein